ncbi:hypothetical protein [uncultured Variovorax sp.]|uniref:hypothetical protein n=1 Tax=uncultured Variovorax sp. TaxID=114708 RepID=UPI0025D6B88C|nr:hypothetical protein [uncultured Variovorax sp.]
MKIWVLVGGTAVVLVGCAGPGYSWVPMPGNSGSLAQSEARCDYETSAATQATDYSLRTSFGQELDRAIRKNDLYEKCMRAQGFQKMSSASNIPPADPRWKVLEDDWSALIARRQQAREQLTREPNSPAAEDLRGEIQSLNVRIRDLERKLSYAPSNPVSTD